MQLRGKQPKKCCKTVPFKTKWKRVSKFWTNIKTFVKWNVPSPVGRVKQQTHSPNIARYCHNPFLLAQHFGPSESVVRNELAMIILRMVAERQMDEHDMGNLAALSDNQYLFQNFKIFIFYFKCSLIVTIFKRFFLSIFTIYIIFLGPVFGHVMKHKKNLRTNFLSTIFSKH